jgi:HEAT repeat protein
VNFILERLAGVEDSEHRRDLAEYITNNPEEFKAEVSRIFDPSEEKKNVDLKYRLLGLIDLLPSKIAIPVLEKAIVDKDNTTRVRALQAVYRTRVDSLNEEVTRILTDTEEEFEARKWAVHILGSSDPKSYGRTLRILAKNREEDIRIRKEAVYALTKVTDDETIGALCALLGDPQVELRRSGAWALSSISSPESIHCLLAALEDADEEVRDWSIRALRDMDDARALQGLADTIARVEASEQVRMIRLMIERRSEIILRAIAELLTSEDPDVKRVAAWAMGVASYPPAAGTLRTLVNDRDEQTRDYARMALLRLGEVDPSDFRL